MLSMAAANTQAQENDKGGHRGLDFTLSPGYQIFTGDGAGGAVSAEVSLGKRFTKNFYWGISSGAYIPTGDGDVQIPITTDFKVLFPLNNKTFTPGVLARGGYVLDPSNTDYSSIMFQAMPTVDVAIGSSVDFSLGVGYTHYVPTKGGGSGSGAVTIRTAFTFHKSTKERTKPKAPTRERGIELTLEGGAGLMKDYDNSTLPNFGGNIVASYKLNSNLNVGVGFGYYCSATEYESFIEYEGERDDTYSEVWGGYVTTKKLFLRGEYALNSRTFAPFASCDLGLNMYSYGDVEINDYYSNTYDDEMIDKIKKSGLFISPAIGASVRVAPNSYLKLRLGYQLAPNSSKLKVKPDEGSDWKKVEMKTVTFSQPYLNIGFTHTFSWGENWFK